jgi:transcriptional regulator with XRE-family HTH domain
MAKRLQFSEQLRRAVLSCGISRYRLSQETGISESLLSRFVNGDVGISLENIDIICDQIGGQLSIVKPPKRKAKGK